MLVAVVRAILTLPALIKVNIGTATPLIVPVAFYAVDVDRGDRALPGLRHPDLPALAARRRASRSGRGTTATKYKWMNPIAVAEIVIVSIYLMLPSTPGGDPVQRRVRVEVRELRARSSPSAR